MLPTDSVHTLLDQAARAGTLDAVYAAALRCVQDGLHVERAAILVSDASRSMRFVASSGLSEAYRAAVDGHSPWRADETGVLPVLVPDVEVDAALAGYVPLFRREHIRALGFFPLQFDANLLGKCVLYYREPHVFSDDEIATAQRVADYVAFTLEHHRISVALEAQLVTERTLRLHAETEAALRQTSESRLALALSAGQMGAWEWDIATGRVRWSEQLERIHGLEPGTFGGTLDDFRHDAHPEDVNRIERAITAALATTDSDYAIEYRIVRRDGACRWLSARGRVLRGDGGRPVRMVGICSDITERRRAEDTIHDADRRKDEFLATLAHELRNPLAPLRASLAVIGRSSDDTATVAEHCTIMERQLSQLTRLVDDLLDLSNLAHRGLSLDRRRIALSTVVRAAVEQSRMLVDEAEHTLLVTLPDREIVIDADPVRLGQVLTNLLSNAVKYTPRGGRIELRAERDPFGVRLSVSDNGIGIPSDKLDTIYEMFGQLDRSFETGYKGLGIGLTLVKALVRMHGGTVEALSDGPGKGSMFNVWLPVPDAAMTDAALPVAVPAPGMRAASTCCRVLLVDDSRDVVRSLARLIRILGHDIRVAFDGLEAIEVAAAFKPDVVLMDIGMPKLNGYDVAREMRSKPWGAAMTLVAVTGWGTEADRRRSYESGFDQHLTKPLEPDVLETLLDACSRRHRSRN